MDQRDFREILDKYLTGCASEAEIQIIEKWYQKMDRKTDYDIGYDDEAILEEQYLANIMKGVDKTWTLQREKPSSAYRMRWYSMGIAASVIVMVASVLLLTNRTAERKEPLPFIASSPLSWKSITNEGKLAQHYTLPDSSRVTLEPNSSLKFSTDFNVSLREVQLDGEGFFEVIPCKEKPFLVYANGVTTKVLGTSFTIRSFHEDSKVSVAVKTGKVSVFAKSSAATKEIILTPNQEIVYDRAEKVVAKRIVKKPEPIISVEEIERMRFEDAPLKEVFDAIEKIYGVDIEYDQDQFAFCTITTSVSGGGLYNRMDIITSTIGAQYELDENRIIVKGTGCN